MRNCKSKNNNFYGHKHTDEYKKEKSKIMSGRKLTEETKQKIRLSHLGIKKTKKDKEGCRVRMLGRIKEGKIKINKGKEHWNWKGGITPLNKLLRENSKYKMWRELVFLRDNFTCQNLNCEYCNNKLGIMLHSHHVKPLALYPKLVFNVNNGITYCAEFHINSKKLHKGIVHNRICESRRLKT